MNNEQLKQIFEDNSDCYADTWEDSGGEMHNGCHMMREGETIQAMTMSKFIEVVSKLLSATNNAESMAVDGWISVEDRLPDIDQEVLCTQDLSETALMAVYTDLGFKVQKYPSSNDRSCISYWISVTHWQPLPQTPKNK